jgi:hypothetical protein
MILGGSLLVVGLALIIVALLVASLSNLLWVGVAVAIVGGVTVVVALATRGRVDR